MYLDGYILYYYTVKAGKGCLNHFHRTFAPTITLPNIYFCYEMSHECMFQIIFMRSRYLTVAISNRRNVI